MGKFQGFVKLIKLLWDNGDKVVETIEKIQGKLPLIIEVLDTSGKELGNAANLIGSIDGEIGDTLEKVGSKFSSVKVPDLKLTTKGFMDTFMDAIRHVTGIPINDPPEDIKNNLNRIRVLDMINLNGQTKPFENVISYFNIEGQAILSASELSKTAIQNTSKGLLDLADILKEFVQE